MDPRPYNELTDLELLILCVWREAQDQGADGMTAVAWSIKNRVTNPSWWGRDWHSVILKPWQYSSFNLSDPNNTKWPAPDDAVFPVCAEVCTSVYDGIATDPTDGATHYYDTSIEFPKSWGRESEWLNTFNVKRLKFWKLRPPMTSEAHLDIEE